MVDNLNSEKDMKVSYHKILAITLVGVFSLLLTFALFIFVSIAGGINKYGGEMADGFGLIIIFPFLIHFAIFLIWSYKIFKLKTRKQNTYFQVGLIFLLGLILPYMLFVRLDFILRLFA